VTAIARVATDRSSKQPGVKAGELATLRTSARLGARAGEPAMSRTSAQQGELATSRTSAKADSRADLLEVPLRADAEVKTTLPPSLRRLTSGVVKVSASVSRTRTA
jgi:hypothetical protein